MYQIEVENIKCAGCSNSIEKALLVIEKIEKIKIDVERGIVIVTGEAGRDQVVAKLTALGYPEKGHNTLMCKAKSYMSCAMGRIG